MFKSTNFHQVAAVLCLAFSSSAVAAQEDCDGIDVGITVVRAQEYAPLIADAAGTSPEEVEFISVLESGSWTVVYAATPVADPGYFFFEAADGKKQFEDVWGGIASTSERAEQVAYAEGLGAPSDLAACFADQTAVIDD